MKNNNNRQKSAPKSNKISCANGSVILSQESETLGAKDGLKERPVSSLSSSSSLGSNRVSLRPRQRPVSSLSSASLRSNRSSRNSQMIELSGEEVRSGLRRSRGSQNLLSVDRVFDDSSDSYIPLERQLSAPVSGCRSTPSSPRVRRPPTKESHHVNVHQTEVCFSNDEKFPVFQYRYQNAFRSCILNVNQCYCEVINKTRRVHWLFIITVEKFHFSR